MGTICLLPRVCLPYYIRIITNANSYTRAWEGREERGQRGKGGARKGRKEPGREGAREGKGQGGKGLGKGRAREGREGRG